MRIGIRTFVTADTMPADRVAVKCESLGFESMWVCDHPILPVHHRLAPTRVDARVGISGHQMPEYYRAVPDPFVLLTQAGAVTRRIKLGTGICLVPEREPIGLAKTVATLDMCTGGRMLFGIGAGGIPLESEVMGVEYRRRWPMTREYIRAMKELWTAHESSFDGEFIKFPPVYCYPKPVQKPHPPIIIGAGGIGASSLRALKDTAALGDGWGPVSIGPAELRARPRDPEEPVPAGRTEFRADRNHDFLTGRAARSAPDHRGIRGGRGASPGLHGDSAAPEGRTDDRGSGAPLPGSRIAECAQRCFAKFTHCSLCGSLTQAVEHPQRCRQPAVLAGLALSRGVQRPRHTHP